MLRGGGREPGRKEGSRAHMGAAATHTTCSGSPPPHTDRAESAPPPPMMLWVSHRGWKQGAPRRHPAGQDHALLGTPRLRESTAAPTCCHSHMHLYFSAPPSALLHNLLWQKKQTNKKTKQLPTYLQSSCPTRTRLGGGLQPLLLFAAFSITPFGTLQVTAPHSCIPGPHQL